MSAPNDPLIAYEQVTMKVISVSQKSGELVFNTSKPISTISDVQLAVNIIINEIVEIPVKFKIIEKKDNQYKLKLNIPKIDPDLRGQNIDRVEIKVIQDIVEGNFKLKKNTVAEKGIQREMSDNERKVLDNFKFSSYSLYFVASTSLIASLAM